MLALLTELGISATFVVMKSVEPVVARPPRGYRMRIRADAAEQTAMRIMDAAVSLWRERAYDDFTLQDVATRAGVSLSTVMRRFDSKEGLAEAVLTSDRVGTQRKRDACAVGDLEGALAMIVDDYEENGDAVIRLLAIEERLDVVHRLVGAGRTAHADWVARTFRPLLSRSPARRSRQTLQLVVATDVYTWKILRRDRRLAAREVAAVMRDMCRAITEREP